MLFRTSDVVMIAIMMFAAAFTYKTKHDADDIMDRIRTASSRIQAEKDAIDVLRADWSLLTQPSRMQDLAKTYDAELGLELVDPGRIVTRAQLGSIPYPQPVAAPELSVMLPSPRPDMIVTGGVKP